MRGEFIAKTRSLIRRVACPAAGVRESTAIHPIFASAAQTFSSQRLAGRICLITGSASGVGLSTARLFAREGAEDRDLRSCRRHPEQDFQASVTRAEVVGRFGRID
jgi:hypothetical protein